VETSAREVVAAAICRWKTSKRIFRLLLRVPSVVRSQQLPSCNEPLKRRSDRKWMIARSIVYCIGMAGAS
jgi:hypothetical protein